MANIDWDVDSYEAKGPKRDLLPAGDYVCVIADTKEKTSAKGSNYIELELQVTQGEYKNATIVDRLNLWHPNETPRNIARGTLKAICDAVGVKARDTQQLVMRPLLVTVRVEEGEHNGRPTQQSVVKGYAKAERPQQQQPQPPRQAVPNNDVSPWGNQF